jgi:hypothetical protein
MTLRREHDEALERRAEAAKGLLKACRCARDVTIVPGPPPALEPQLNQAYPIQASVPRDMRAKIAAIDKAEGKKK